jgi:uncharacterized membrane protein
LSKTASPPEAPTGKSARRDGPPWLAIALLGYPVLVQAAVRSGRPLFAFAAIALLAVIAGLIFLRPSNVLGWSVVAALVGTAYAICFSGNGQSLLYLPPVLISLALLLFFGRTLRPGSEPLITRFARVLRRGWMPDEVVRYTRRVTQVWVVVFGLMAVEATLLAMFAPLEIWALFTNFINYAVIVVLLAGEYLYHSRRYPNNIHHSFAEFARDLASVDFKRILTD